MTMTEALERQAKEGVLQMAHTEALSQGKAIAATLSDAAKHTRFRGEDIANSQARPALNATADMLDEIAAQFAAGNFDRSLMAKVSRAEITAAGASFELARGAAIGSIEKGAEISTADDLLRAIMKEAETAPTVPASN